MSTHNIRCNEENVAVGNGLFKTGDIKSNEMGEGSGLGNARVGAAWLGRRIGKREGGGGVVGEERWLQRRIGKRRGGGGVAGEER